MVWPVVGSWWPSWSIHSMTLSRHFLFFPGFREPGFLYRLPVSAIAHRQSLSNASILGISLEGANVLCKWNGLNAGVWEGIQSVSSALPKTNISFTKKLKMQFYRHPTLAGWLKVVNCSTASAIAIKLLYLHCTWINKMITIWLRRHRSAENEWNQWMIRKCWFAWFNLWLLKFFTN